MKKWINTGFLLVSIIGNLLGQRALEHRMQDILESGQWGKSETGISVINDQGDVLFSKDPWRKMTPASTLKLITSWTILDIKGWNFKYTTTIYHNGSIAPDGTLTGDIIIKGSGDPTLGSPREEVGRNLYRLLDEIVEMVKKLGIQCIDGNILVYNGAFDEEAAHPSWAWNDVGNYYGGGVYGLNINENEYSLYFDREKPEGSQAVIVKHEPLIEELTFDNYVTVAGRNTGDQAYIYGGQGFFHKIIKGTVPRGKGEFDIRGSMPHPPGFFAEALKKALDQAGISSENSHVIRKIEDQSLKKLGEITSPPLSTLVSLNNAFSINLYSEAFLKTLAKDGTRKDGIKRIYEHLQSEGLNVNGLLMADGSGLSPSNAVAPQFFTTFLLHYLKKWEKKPFHTTLPKPGSEGTMKYFLNGSKAGRKMWVKSGYIGGVLSYAGWMENEKGNRVIFSIMVNHIDVPASNVRKNIERLLETIYHHSN